MITPKSIFSLNRRVYPKKAGDNRSRTLRYRSQSCRLSRCLLLLPLILVLILPLIVGSCATSSGSTYSSSVEGEGSAAARAAEAKNKRQDSRATEADERGWPYTESQTRPYQSSYQNSYYESPTIVFSILVPSGSISVQGAPVGAQLLVDGMAHDNFTATEKGSQAYAKLDAGQHRVRVEHFGFSSWEAEVFIQAGGNQSLKAELRPVPFSLRASGSQTLVFDPARPGRAGTITAGFTATGPGTAVARVMDSSGRILLSLGSRDITGWSVPVSWDGRDGNGMAVPAGTYTIGLSGSGPGPGTDSGLVASEASIQVTTARFPAARVSSLHGGFSGAMLAPDTLILSPGTFQTSAGAYAFIDLGEGTSRARIPVWAGIRMGGLPYPGAELVLTGMLTSYPGYDQYPPMDGVSVAGSIKSPLLDGEYLAAALLLRATAASFIDEASSGWPPSWDGAARFPGLGAGVVFQWTPGGSPARNPGRPSGNGRLFASIELDAGRFYPGWSDGAWDVPGFFVWPYARAGIETLLDLNDAGRLSVQGSVAARGQPVGTPQGFRPPLSLAGELAWYPPSAPYVLHAYGIGEWEGFYSWYFAGGVGISVLF